MNTSKLKFEFFRLAHVLPDIIEGVEFVTDSAAKHQNGIELAGSWGLPTPSIDVYSRMKPSDTYCAYAMIITDDSSVDSRSIAGHTATQTSIPSIATCPR